MTRYSKAIAALLGAVSTWGVTAWQTGNEITGDEWFGLIGVFGTVFAVYAVANDPTEARP